MTRSAESIEAESALVRSQLVEIGAEIRHHADPAVIVDAAKSSFKRQVDGAPSFLKQNATPVGMVLIGGALGAALAGLFSRRAHPIAAPSVVDAPVPTKSGLSLNSQVSAAALSTAGVGIGYFAAMFIPKSATEDRLLSEPKAVLAQHFDDFLRKHSDGMKKTTANAFGLARLSATTLVGLAMLAEALGASPPAAKTDSL